MNWSKLLEYSVLLEYFILSIPGVALVAAGAALGGLNAAFIFLVPLFGIYLLGRNHGAEALMKAIKASMKETVDRT